jgi:hypothetical protein
VDILVFFKLGLASLVRLVVLVLSTAITCHQRVPDASGKNGCIRKHQHDCVFFLVGNSFIFHVNQTSAGSN